MAQMHRHVRLQSASPMSTVKVPTEGQMFIKKSQSKAVWIAKQMKMREAEFTEISNVRYVICMLFPNCASVCFVERGT